MRCPHCKSPEVTKQGHDKAQPSRRACQRYFDDLTGTIFAGHHQSLRVWVLCPYLMWVNLSNRQIAQELGWA